MPASYSDVLLIGGVPNQWIKLVSNGIAQAAGTAYVSDAVTTFPSSTQGGGVFSFATGPLADIYTVWTLSGSLSSTKPASGDTRWVATGNTNYVVAYTAGDAAALKSGSFSNGPNTSLFPAGGTNPLTAGTASALYDMGGVMFHAGGPKYRAIGTWDPIAITGDATAAIQQAVTDALALAGAGIVMLPRGTPILTDDVVLGSNLDMRGVGRSATTLQCSVDGKNGLRADVTNGTRGIVLRDFRLVDTLGAGRTTGHGILIDGSADATVVTMDHVTTTGFQDGVHLVSLLTSELDDVRSNNARRYGFAAFGSGTTTTYRTCYASGSLNHGFYFDGQQQYFTLDATASQPSAAGTGSGYYLNKTGGACANFTFNSAGCESTGALGDGFHFEDGNGHVLNAPKVGGTVGAILGDGLRFNGTTRAEVNGGTVFGCIGYGANVTSSATPSAPVDIHINGTRMSGNLNNTTADDSVTNLNAPNGGVTWRHGPATQTFGLAAVNGTLGARLDSETATGSSAAGGGETDLQTYTVPASTVTANGQLIRITAWGGFAANANAKQVRLYFAGAILVDSTSIGKNGGSWRIVAEVLRNSSTTSAASAQLSTDQPATMGLSTSSQPAVTWANANIAKCTGIGTNLSDVTERGLIVEVLS